MFDTYWLYLQEFYLIDKMVNKLEGIAVPWTV